MRNLRQFYLVGRRLIVTLLLICTSGLLFAQINISGIVATDQGEFLENVTVNVKGTDRNTVTDKDGKFTITVPGASSILVFSFVGYPTKEITVGNQTYLEIF